MLILRTLALCSLLSSSVVAMKQEDTATQTVWDQIMAAQAMREVHSGAEYMQEKQYDRASREFAKAIISRPNDPMAHMMLGAAYYWSGQVEQAAAEFKETLRLDPKNAQGHLLMGIVHAWKGDIPAAHAEFVEAEKYAPDRPDVQMDLGSIEESLGLLDSAVDHLRKAVKLDPENAIYYYQLGMLYRHLGRDDDAIDSMKTAVRKNPEYEDAILELAAALERRGKTKEAQDMFHKAVRLKSRDAVARLRLSRAYLLNGNPDKARDAIRDAFHLTPATGSGLALAMSYGGKPKENHASAPSNATPRDTTEPKDPLDMLARNLQRIPLDQDAKLSVEMLFLKRPKLTPVKRDEGGSELKRALAVAGKPSVPAATGVRRDFILPAGSAAEREARIQKVLEDLRETAKKAPSDSDTRLAMNLNFLPKSGSAAAGGKSGRPSDKNNPKASFNPHDVGNDMGLWVLGTGWVPLVEEVLPLAGEEATHPDNAMWWVVDGLGYATLGNGSQALAAFDRALKLNPADEIALLGRGVALVETGEEEQAIATYRKVLELNPKSRAAQEGLKWLLMGPAK